jgi:GT2 family glycosyltransferase
MFDLHSAARDLTALSLDAAKSCTIVIVPRERFGVAVRSLESVAEHNPTGVPVIYIDAASPSHVARSLKKLCEKFGYQYCRYEEPLSPNEARNLGWRKAHTPFVAFIDNDIIVSRDWLSHLIACAQETGAAVVAPLTCQKEPIHSEIHQAGGEFAQDHRAFFSLPIEERRITDVHVKQGEPVRDTQLVQGETQCCEFHCALVRVSTLEKAGGLDEALLATKEHIDFCMGVWASGERVMFEPQSVVTYLFPSRSSPLERSDWSYFTLRWSPRWQSESLEHFQKKWGLYNDPYFEKRQGMLKWRLREAIAKPVVNKIPGISRSYSAKQAAATAVTEALVLWSKWLALRHRSSSGNAANVQPN